MVFSRRSLLVTTAILLAAVSIGGLTWWLTNPSSESLLRQARLELARGQFRRAEQLAVRAAGTANPSDWALVVAGQAAIQDGRFADALEHYSKSSSRAGEAGLACKFGAAEALAHLGKLEQSERHLKEILRTHPDYSFAQIRLAFLLNVTGRRWEASPYLLSLIQTPAGTLEHLLLLGSIEHTLEDHQLLAAARVADPADPWPLLGQARVAISKNQFQTARQILAQIQEKYRLEPEIQVRWGEVLLGTREDRSFARWSDTLASIVESHPDAWTIRGTHFSSQGDLRTSARCLWEAVRRNPNSRLANYQLGQVLTKLGDLKRAKPFLERANLLQQLSIVLNDLYSTRDHIVLMGRAAILTEQLGRIWEAAAWCRFALEANPNTVWARRTLDRIRPFLRQDAPQTALQGQAISEIDLTDFPLPIRRDSSDTSITDVESTAISTGDQRVQFEDDTERLGLKFQYHNSADPKTPGARIFETTGGGVGVLDYDCDGWPDLYLTQGAARPPESLDQVFLDQLYRNQMGERFENVTQSARLGDPDFSQGVAVGDFNNDGFADVYVANYGANRLYQNCGDGTFEDVTQVAGLSGAQWTTSCLCADINGDSWPDLFDVNYCSGDNVEALLCHQFGKSRSCSPRAFDAAADRFWLSRGDGTFQDVSKESGILVPNGYGLGIVAADFAGTGNLSVFVANDEVPNFLFTNTNSKAGGIPRFQETALAAGVAVDRDGLSQACMGVGVADADGNGLVDLFVTNFYRESNTLYLQQGPGLFSDETRTANLRDASYDMLGFGTQFLDGELDGYPDLVLTNGHIDDLTHLGQPYKMPPQYFQNLGKGRFHEVPAKQLGPFFEKRYLGRGLARIDWNLDGLDEFVVSHLEDPSAIVTNRTRSPGHYLTLELRGRSGSRDAIGASVQVTGLTHSQHLQLSAGDGYHASNHRQLTIGLGSQPRVQKLKVIWPGGLTQTWQDLAANQRLLLIEGKDQPVVLHADR